MSPRIPFGLRRQRLGWALALALLGSGTGSSPAAAQQLPLGEIAAAVAGHWSNGNADAIARLMSESGVALYLLDQSQPAAGIRQARAALAALLGRSGRVRIARVEELGGAPRRGFAELEWEVMEPGSPEGLRYVVFLGFVAGEPGWRIAEVRVLR